MNHFFKKNRGFMLVEILVATSIIIVAILAIMSATQKSVTVSHQALHSSQAAFLLEEGAEAVRIFRDNTWDNISGLSTSATYYPNFSGGTWVLSTTPSQIGIFTRTVNIKNVNRSGTTGDIVNVGGTVDVGSKLVTVTVSWNEGGTTLGKTLLFYIMNLFS